MKKLAMLAILTLRPVPLLRSLVHEMGVPAVWGRTSDRLAAIVCSRVLAVGRRMNWETRKIDRSGFVYARLRYHPVEWWRQRTSEIPWHHDYPSGDTMLPDALSRLTKVHTTRESYQIVDIDSKELFKFPFVYLAEPGLLDLLPEDVKNLREYLDRGGFLFIDDFRGNERDNSEMENLIVQLQKLYPDRNLVPLPRTHLIFSSFFETDPTNMLPPYRRPNSGDPQFLGLSDDKDRLLIMVDFNNDLSEYWQTLDVGVCSINESGTAVQLGINYVIYAMTH